MTATLNLGTIAAGASAAPPRSFAPRLAWAGAASLLAHAALFYVPATTTPSANQPVMALIVRSIATTTEVGSRSSISELAVPSPKSETPVRSAEPLGAPVHPRAARSTSDSAPSATRTERASPERASARSALSNNAANSTSRDAATPARAQGPVYHLPGELDPPPRPLQDIEPVYPPEAGFQPGTVVLRLFIDESGTVERVDVVQTSSAGLFENAARTAFLAARFSPGRIAGIAVKCQLTIEVEFTPINRGSDVSGRTY